MSLAEQQAGFACDVAKLINHIFSAGYTCTFGEAFRSAEQAEIYARQGKGIKNSLHCDRLAVDLNLFKGGQYLSDTDAYQEIGEFWESLSPSNRWGGRFNDGNHFERKKE